MGKPFPNAPRRSTIVDVASRAGVSPGTVSKYLGRSGNDSYYVSDATKERIAAAISDLNFQPNALARGLIHRRSQTVGVVVASVVNPLYSELITGIDEVLTREGYTLIFASTEGSALREAEVLSSLQQRQVDGIILASVTVNDEEVAKLVENGLDVILASRHIRSSELVDAVVIDNEDGARLAAEHLIAHGHTRIGHIAGPQDIYPFEIRRTTFQRVLAQAGLDVTSVVVAEGLAQAHGVQALRRLLSAPDPPTAVFAANDLLALGVIEEAAAQGSAVPGDLAVIGFDNIWVGGVPGVQLTSVDSRGREIGRVAAKELLGRIRRPADDQNRHAAGETHVLPTRLVRRGTCGCPFDASAAAAVGANG